MEQVTKIRKIFLNYELKGRREKRDASTSSATGEEKREERREKREERREKREERREKREERREKREERREKIEKTYLVSS
jgi:hypothetical protein